MENEHDNTAQTPTVYERKLSTMDPEDPILKLIVNKNVDLARVEKVLALRREVEEEAARRAFNVAMVAVKGQIPVIVKNAANTDNNSQYATLDAIGELVDPVLSANGITASFYPLPTPKENYVRVECVIAHVAGYERRFEVEVPFDSTGIAGKTNKTNIHAWRSATTYARRTLYEMIFDIKSKKLTKDDDGNAAGALFVINDEQIAELRKLIAATGTAEDFLLKQYERERLEDISPVLFGEIRILLEQKLRKLKGAQS